MAQSARAVNKIIRKSCIIGIAVRDFKQRFLTLKVRIINERETPVKRARY